MLQLKASFKNRPTTGRKRSTGTLLRGGRGVVKGWWGGEWGGVAGARQKVARNRGNGR